MEKKKEYKYKVSDFWLFQKTFEKVLHSANIKDMSINQWLIHAVEEKLRIEEEELRLKEIKIQEDNKEYVKNREIQNEINKLQSLIYTNERKLEEQNSSNMEKARALFHKKKCEYCGSEVNTRFYHMLRPMDKSRMEKEAWSSFCNTTCLTKIGYNKNTNFKEKDLEVKERLKELYKKQNTSPTMWMGGGF